MRPFIKKFRKLNVSGDGRLGPNDLKITAEGGSLGVYLGPRDGALAVNPGASRLKKSAITQGAASRKKAFAKAKSCLSLAREKFPNPLGKSTCYASSSTSPSGLTSSKCGEDLGDSSTGADAA